MTVFGMPDEAREIEGAEALADDPVEEATEETPEAPEAPEAAEAEIDPAGRLEPDEQAPEAEEAPSGYEFAGRFFTSQDEAERAYREMQGLQSRTVEQQRAIEQQWQAERAQMAAFLQQVEPVLRQAQQPAPQAPTVPGPGDQNFDAENPEHVAAWVNHQVDQRTNAAMSQMQQQFDQRLQQTLSPMQAQQQAWMAQQAQQRVEQDLSAYSADIDSFRSEHPEVTVGSTAEAAVAGVLQPLRIINVMPSRPMLQMALDATRAPALYREIEAERINVERTAQAARVSPSDIPSLFDSDSGIATLYQRAGLAPQGTQTRSQTSSQRPHVETGGNGAPVDTAPGQTPDDLDNAFAKHMEDQKTASPLFGGGVRV